MKCKVCEKNFKLKKENRYEVSSSIFDSISTYVKEAFDYPRCGCQLVVNERIKERGRKK